MHSLKGLMDVRCLKLQGGILSRPCRFPCWKLWNLKDSGLEGICPVLWAEVLLDQPSRVKGEAVKILSPFTIIFIKLPDSSVGKESACSTGDRVGKIPWRRDRLPTPVFVGFPCGSAGKESTCNEGDLGSIPGLGRSPEEGKGYPLQYSGLENSMDCIVHGVTKNRTQLSDFHFTIA